MRRRPPRSTQSRSSAASDVYKRQTQYTRGLARVTQAFRARYYQLALRVLRERRQVISCYAGWAGAHIAPNGDIWSCCIRAEPVGSLRKTNYDLAPIWFGEGMAVSYTHLR